MPLNAASLASLDSRSNVELFNLMQAERNGESESPSIKLARQKRSLPFAHSTHASRAADYAHLAHNFTTARRRLAARTAAVASALATVPDLLFIPVLLSSFVRTFSLVSDVA